LFVATALTSATGFGFKAPFGPSHVVGVILLVLLAGSTLALYVLHPAGWWPRMEAIGQTLALFVLVAQVFKKVPALGRHCAYSVRASVRGGRGCGACHLSGVGGCGQAVSPAHRRHDADVGAQATVRCPSALASCVLGLAEARMVEKVLACFAGCGSG
jgi:hypothetical protein